ncbi:hypothetical protein F2Q69_00036296 [Brassica cretica]|uniref:Transposase MuDR plant domain-containing protein n=1 Tax=Brassica cretica TaxID=69181 RepID=A0A8S9SDA6_BRACR|nr:hypothetical protein F2Q69_00036296 [Brassica cretica]
MDRQLHAVYGEWLLKDGYWNFVVDKFKEARLFFLSEGSTHAELVAMAQEDYNLDMNTESVQLAYSLPEAMMQQMAPDTPPIHVTSDRQVRNLLEIAKTHEVHFKGTYGSEGGRSYGSCIYVNQSFASKDALVSELRLTAVRRKFSFRIYKSTKTLLVATCRVNGCRWKIRASVKHDTNTFWVTKYVETHTCSVGDRITQRKHCTAKYIGRLFIDRVGIIDGLNPHHIKDAMKNMFGKTLDYTTSYKALLYAQELIADTMSVQKIDGWRFFVHGGKKDCVVDLEHQKCDFGVYGVEKIPCSHAIAAGSYAGLHNSTLVCPVYSKDILFAGYSENIYHCVGQQTEAHTRFPPEVKRGPGRHKKSKWQSWLELSKMRGRTPRKQHRVYRCSVCKETGHTRPHCKN